MLFKKNEIFTLKYVKAGEAGKVLQISSQNISTEEFNEEAFDKIKCYTESLSNDAFMVIGESMAQEYIHTEDILLSRQCDHKELNKGDLIILEVDPTLFSQFVGGGCVFGYKLRKFIMTINLNESEQILYNKLCEVEIDTNFVESSRDVFHRKYEKAKSHIKGEAMNEVLLSITYTEDGKEYSFHAVKNLCAVVEGVLKKDSSGKYKLEKI